MVETHSGEPQAEGQGHMQSGETTPGSNKEQKLEIDFYPPLQEYQWMQVEKLHEEEQAALKSMTEREGPRYDAKELLMPLGRVEEQQIVGLALKAAMFDLEKSSEFPRLLTAGVIANRSVALSQGERKGVGYVFLKNQGASEEAYSKAREMWLEKTNANLESINRNKIPPPGTQTPPPQQ